MSNLKSFKPFLFLFFLTTYYILHTTYCFSFGDFSISYDTTYEVKESGITEVNQSISLKNKTSDYYATEYTLVLIGQEVSKVNASDNLGPLKTEIKKEDDKTSIHVFFNEKIAGINKFLKWSLSYETKSLASKNGLVWELILPGPPKEEDLENYNVSLKVPNSFGPPLYLWPKPQNNFYPAPDGAGFYWTKNELSKGGITGSFGNYQIFDFKILYHLKNLKLIGVTTEIAIPADTSYQKVNYANLDPKPLDIKIDKDGNWLAQYNLAPKEKIDVLAQGHAKIFFKPQKSEILTNKEFKNYLLPRRFWESETKEIQNLAKELNSPKKIYDFVVSNLKYNYQKTEKKPERLGALSVLKNKDDAICLEFSDLFVAMSRAAGIPARVNNGYAYTTNPKLRPLSLSTDILHAWPEYYDSLLQSWIMVDPTWGNTTGGLDYFSKLDLNHFVFAKKGSSSIYPNPAGSYKEEDSKQKDAFVSFSNFDKETKDGNLEVYLYLPEEMLGIFPLKGEILIINTGPGAVDLNNLEIKTNPSVFFQKLDLGLLPPFGKKEIPVNIAAPYFLKNLVKLKPEIFNLTLQLDESVYNHKIRIEPLISRKILYILLGGICVAILSLAAGKAWNLYLQRRKK